MGWIIAGYLYAGVSVFCVLDKSGMGAGQQLFVFGLCLVGWPLAPVVKMFE